MPKRRKVAAEPASWTTDPEMPHDIDLDDNGQVEMLCERFGVERAVLEHAVREHGSTYMTVKLFLTAPAV